MNKLVLLFSGILALGAFAETYTIEVQFSSHESALEYLDWMSGQGEDDMRVWMDENRPSLSIYPSYDYQNLVIDLQEESTDENR